MTEFKSNKVKVVYALFRGRNLYKDYSGEYNIFCYFVCSAKMRVFAGIHKG